MRKLHVIPNHPIFVNRMIALYENEFKDYAFSYCVFDKRKGGEEFHVSSEFKNIKCIHRKNWYGEIKEMYKLLKENDIVFFHSMFLSPTTKIALSIFPRLLKKIVWIEWGFDIYIEAGDGIVQALKYYIKKIGILLFDRRISHFVSIHEMDFSQYDTQIKGNARKYLIRYASENTDFSSIYTEKVTMLEKKEKGEPLVIQIGHRAERNLNHISILKMLETFKGENIQILLPLSYGDPQYAQEVAEIARQIYEDKAVVLSDVMSNEEYKKIISQVDIFILDSTRQIALGNIHQLMASEKKIYLPHNSVMTKYFRNKEIPICEIESLKGISFSDLSTDVDMKNAKVYVKAFYQQDVIALWDKMFKETMGEHTDC